MKPWTTERSRHVVRDRWISLRADDCRTAQGVEVAPFYVLEYPDWVNVVALTPHQEVVLIRQYRHPVGRALLELPGGAIDPGDASPADAARRELREETGYEGELVETGSVFPNAASCTNRTHCFLATDCRRVSSAQLEPSETLESVVLPLREFVSAAFGGELEQAQHVASAVFALQELGLVQTDQK